MSRRPRGGLGALGLAALLAGCAAPHPTDQAVPAAASTSAGRPDASDLPTARQLGHIPFLAQPDWQCGPAALAILMAAAGHPVPVASLAEDAFVPGLKGTLQAEMLTASRRRGLLAMVLPPDFDALRREIADGRPVIVLQNLGLAALPRWHYAVLIGYDLEAGQVTLHSGDEPMLRMGRGVFERTWARSGRWAMTVTAPTLLPASADEPRSVQAVIGLERVDATAAAQAWGAIARRWPDSRLAPFGLANLRLAQGDPRAAADRAVGIGGSRQALYRETLAELSR